MAAVIEAHGLVKVFKNGQRAVDGVDLTVQPGEVYGFLGPNGAGKTTTMKMILGLTHPTSGSALILGKDPWKDPRGARQSLGFLPENLSFYKTLTAPQTLRFFAELRNAPVSEVDERIAQVGLAEHVKKPVGQYSKGMVQRLGIAVALLGNPPLLVFDEPTSGLDPMGARQVKDLMRELNARGTTILFSSHILSEVQEVAHRVGIIRRGRVVAEDSVAALRDRLNLPGKIILTLEAGSPAGVADAVRAVAGVADVHAAGNVLEVTCDAASRWRVSQAAEQAGAKIANMETRDASLEDVFMRLTGDEPAKEATA